MLPDRIEEAICFPQLVQRGSDALALAPGPDCCLFAFEMAENWAYRKDSGGMQKDMRFR